MEQNQVYELFEDLLRQLVVSKPAQPLQWLHEKIKMSQVRRVFLVGAPGSQRQENMEAIAEAFQWQHISTAKVLRNHVAANGPHASRIAECFNRF